MFSHEPAQQSRHHNQQGLVSMMPGERAYPFRMSPMRFQWQVVAVTKNLLALAPYCQRLPSEIELDVAIEQALEQMLRTCGRTLIGMQSLDRSQGRMPRSVVHRTPVVRVTISHPQRLRLRKDPACATPAAPGATRPIYPANRRSRASPPD
jgi:hypothetical protein